MQTHQPFRTRPAYDYIRYLIQHKEVDQAVLVWRQTAIVSALFVFAVTRQSDRERQLQLDAVKRRL